MEKQTTIHVKHTDKEDFAKVAMSTYEQKALAKEKRRLKNKKRLKVASKGGFR